MGTVHIGKWFDPKPGHEFQFALAWKHRAIASHLMVTAPFFARLFQTRRYRKAFQLWCDALDRQKIHGQDRVLATWR